MEGDARCSAWLDDLESVWRRELQAQRAAVEEIWRTPLATRLADGDALQITKLRKINARQLFVVPVDAGACRMREGDFLCLSQNNPYAPVGKFIHLGEDDEGLHLWCWWGEMPEPGSDGWVLDRDFVDLGPRFAEATAALAETNRGREQILPFLLGEAGGESDGEVFSQTMDELEEDGPQDVSWHDSQQEAIAACLATRDGYLVQGPPGTGKTFVLSEVVRRLIERGERVLVTGPTHRAIQHALEGCRRLLPDEIRVVKVGPAMLARGPIEPFETFADSGLIEESGGYVVGATPFALWSAFTGLKEVEFDTVVIDEASQVTVMVAVMAMLRAEHWLFFGDDCQLPPVMISNPDGGAPGASIFRLLKNRGFETMLEETWRLNEQLASWPSATFYGGRLICRSDRRLTLDPAPQHPALLVEHAISLVLEEGGRATVRSEKEAQTVADLVRELVRTGIRPEDIGVITPFRAQAAAIRAVLRIPTNTPSLHRRITVDTVERFQGQEREVILVSLASARPDWVRRLACFLFQPQRWNVVVTRARRKLIVVASNGLIETSESLADEGDPAATCFSSWHCEAALNGCLVSNQEKAD